MAKTVAKVKASRTKLAEDLKALGFSIVPSQANFLFVKPPSGDGKGYFEALRERKILVRYFPAPRTAAYVRITIGTPEEMDALVKATKGLLQK